MPEYRIQYASPDGEGKQPQSIPVPDVRTALIVADINMPEGTVELWDGQTLMARLVKEQDAQATYWKVSPRL